MRDFRSLPKSTYTLEGIWLNACMKFASRHLFISVLNVRVTIFDLAGKYGSDHAAWIVTLFLVPHFHFRRLFAKAGSEYWGEGGDDLLSSSRCVRDTWWSLWPLICTQMDAGISQVEGKPGILIAVDSQRWSSSLLYFLLCIPITFTTYVFLRVASLTEGAQWSDSGLFISYLCETDFATFQVPHLACGC